MQETSNSLLQRMEEEDSESGPGNIPRTQEQQHISTVALQDTQHLAPWITRLTNPLLNSVQVSQDLIPMAQHKPTSFPSAFINHITPLLRPTTQISLLMVHLLWANTSSKSPDFSNSYFIRNPHTWAKTSPESTLETQTSVPSFLLLFFLKSFYHLEQNYSTLERRRAAYSTGICLSSFKSYYLS